MAILCLLALPVSISLWHKSYAHPVWHRYDVTLYKSLWIYLKDGVCQMHVLSMPTKVASRSEFHTPISYPDLPKNRTLALSSTRQGPYRSTWLVFPFWFPTAGLTFTFGLAAATGPVRKWHRQRTGCCTVCGYSLEGNRSGRCPECGTPWRS